MPKPNEKHAVWITDTAKDATFVNCEIEGLKNEGERTQVFGSKIFNYRKTHPGIWWTILTGIIVTVLGGIILLIFEYNIFAP